MTGSLRVLFDGYWWSRGPAANRSVQRDLVLAWEREFPHDSLVLALRDREHPPDLPERIGIVKTRLWPHGASNMVELSFQARTVAADIIVTHNFAPRSGRSLVFIHDAMFIDHPEWFTMGERAYFSRMLPSARRASRVATSSITEARRIERLAPRLAPIAAVGLGIPSAISTAEPSRPAEVRGDLSFALTVGRLNVRKNLEAVIAAAAASRSITPRSPLLIVGSGEHSGRDAGLPDSVEALRVEGSVRFLGRLSDAEIAWLYQHAALCISLSRDEGFGLTPVEAAFFGAPLLVSDTPVHRETVGSYARFVPLDASPEDGGAAIDDAWADPPDATARSDIIKRYQWRSVVSTMRALVALG